MLMMSGCFGSGYTRSDPCYKLAPPLHRCVKKIESANFIGVGFDVTESYTSESRYSPAPICRGVGVFFGVDLDFEAE